MTNALFVYGTLRPGYENEVILTSIGGAFVKASVIGIHYPDGWIDGFPYPGVKLDEGGEEISGFVFESDDLMYHWGRLDAFEGANYKRVLTKAFLEDRATITCYIYVINTEFRLSEK